MRPTTEDEFTAYVSLRRVELVRTAVLLTGDDRALAEDLVQTTLTKVYLAWPRIRQAAHGGEGPHAYARRCLANALADEHRRPWRRRERPHAELPDRPGPSSDEGLGALGPALLALPPRMRAVVVFRFLHDMSVTETAAALDCSEGTVKSQTARGLEHLRAALPSLDTLRSTP